MTETKMQLVDWLDELCVRFIINLPHEELTSVERICFQIEEAQWFYEDFVRAQDPQLPQMNLRRFCELIFQHCPLLAPFQASAALSYAEFLAYKTRVPVRGAIMLNDDMSEVVLVKGWNKKAKWSFPRGKINKEEKDLDCAIREVYEETGYDVKEAGLVAEDENSIKYIDMSLREQQMRLYVFRDVPMDTHFEPKTRKEISKISWFKVSELAATGNQKNAPHQQHQQPYGQPISQDALKSSQFYMVAPFIRPLKHWIKQQRKLDQQNGRKAHVNPAVEESEVEALQVPNQTMMYDDGMMTTDPEDDLHFKKLLSNLQGGVQQPAQASVPVPVPEPAAASTADLSAQLKAMLSVGGPAAMAAPPQQAESNPLMNILFGKPQVGAPGMLPHTPMEQITSTPPQAHTPHHHHPRPPPQHADMGPPPPNFPISPPQMHQIPPTMHQGPPGPWQGQPHQPYHRQILQMSPPVHHHQPGPPPPQEDAHQRGVFGTNIPAPPPTQISNPLQTGDPAFRSQFPQYNQAPAPLPIPKPAPQKLSNHAMSLLNVFKSPPSTAAQPVQQQPAQASPAHLPELADQSKPLLPSELLGGAHLQEREPSPPQIHQPRAQRSRNAHQDSLLNLFKSAATPVAPGTQGPLHPPEGEPVELAAQPSPNVVRDLAKPMQHKLSMRRLPNVNTDVDISHAHSPHLTSATVSGPLNAPDFETVRKNQPVRPVELGNGVASPSPGTSVGAPGYQVLPRPGSGRVPSRQATMTPPVPVHTVSHATAMEAPRPFHPTTILRKSAKDIAEMAKGQGQSQSHVPVQNVLPEMQTGGANPQGQRITPQPHPQPQPQPQQVPVGQQQAHPGPSAQPRGQVPTFDRRDSGNLAQKNALLSLFGGGAAAAPAVAAPQPASRLDAAAPLTAVQRSPAEFPGSLPISAIPPGHGRASGIGSPVSPLPSHLPRQTTADLQQQQHEPTPRSSRISSMNSVPGDAGMPPLPPFILPGGAVGATSAPKSRATPPVKRGSMVSDAGGSGAQSPITPVEKNFLLGYLQGVVTKENNARTSRQNSMQQQW